jgi:WD40 repeat protein
MKFLEKQLTSDSKGHFLNHTQIFSPDGKWLVYDTRNDDSKIASTGSIEIVNIETGEIKEIYHTKNQTEYGPGVGAVTFSPIQNRVLFIHGIRNSDQNNPYSFTRRTGVAVDLSALNEPLFLDARDILPPFTAGALRGGTHAHSWSGDGKWISFTYNDYVIEQLSKTNSHVQDLRTVGVMFPKDVLVADDNTQENHRGKFFSAIVTEVTENPKPGSDEINKAFDECWIGVNGYAKSDEIWQNRAIAFQGNVIDENGDVKTEIFVVDIPDDITKAKDGKPLEGTLESRPNIPLGVKQRRITFTKHGVLGPRHWLRSTPDGKWILFLAKEKSNFINIYAISTNGGTIEQITYHDFDIQSGINISPDGKYISYVALNAVFISELFSNQTYQLTVNSNHIEKPTGSVMWSPDGCTLAYNRYVNSSKGNYLQVFLLQKEIK